ncbi:hypothetical protein H310_13436 [Aphanomyces invadans]|uniref:RING-type domain-containing protein n=1 Tax=Aphanomyces invadans TaxID=157072 RepID=A0A024TDR5_9STRA|nr:hypothetical protein H310_13436 [Aphanomyces invadans]ETV92198.1 hypothetical protein H310_13436 [Aphanomyces invadans]|eukprot:XP_008879162.1 hypothetical protein H310_13436 [Aphanomyces invadans]
MVFVSFEGFLGAVPGVADAPALEVVVTPGSPPKQSMTQRRRGSPLKSVNAQYVVFVQDKAVTGSTYALRKTHVEIAALHDAIRTCIREHPCTIFACCGPLRRLAKKSSRPPAPSMKLKLFDDGSSCDIKVDAACTQRTWVVETFVNDLLHATTGRDADCAAVDRARQMLHLFLDIPPRRHSYVVEALRELQHQQRTGHMRKQTQPPPSSTPLCFKTHEVSACCPICLMSAASQQPDEASDATNDIVTFGCGHSFHPSCVQTWLVIHLVCPACRMPVATCPPRIVDLVETTPSIPSDDHGTQWSSCR